MAACSKFGLMLGSATVSWTINSSELSPPDWGILIVVSIMGLRGVEVGCVFLNCSSIVGPFLSRESVLGVDAFSSASAIPHFYWTNGIYRTA